MTQRQSSVKRKGSVKSDKKKMQLSSEESDFKHKSTKKKVLASKSARSAKKKSSGKIESFEKAVEKARGLPDGAMGDSDESDMETSGASGGDEMMDDDTSPKAMSKFTNSKAKSFEKGKKTPLNVLTKAASKLKKAKGKEETPKKPGQKRKLSEKEGDGDKKPKLEEMSVKERKKVRKTAKSNYEIAQQAKKMWEQLRRMNLTPERRYEVSGNLYGIIKGKTKELIFAHDTSRIIQCLMKYGAQEHKNALFDELKGDVVEMCKSKYAKFFVRKLLKYGTKDQRHHVFKSLHGHVRKLIRHKDASEIIELAYNDYANQQQRQSLIEEFYGPSFALFKTPEQKTLEQILAATPEKKESVLANMKESLTILVSKGVLQFSIVHKVFKDYFNHCSEKQTAEMIQIVRDSVIHMLHTNDGAEIARMCVWHGNVKDRKALVKSMKTFVVKVCKEEYGHLVLLALFDCVDDTKLVSKAILEELLKSVDDVAKDTYGRKVLLYLLAPRDTKHFHPDIVKKLQPGDGNVNSKKDSSKRSAELLEYVSKPLVQYIASHCEQLVSDNSQLVLVLCILTHVTCDPTEAMIALSKVAAKPFTAASQGGVEHIIESSAGHMTYKKLLQNDKERLKQGQVLFGSILMDILPKGTLRSWAACNRGCFLIVFLLELCDPDIGSKVKTELTGISDSLKKMDFKGAQILHSKLCEKSTNL